MSLKLAAEGDEHKRLVRRLGELVEEKGFKLDCSSSLGLNECPETKGHIPDLKAYNYKEDVWLYGEAKTKDDIDNNHTRSQIKAFSGRTMKGSNKLIPCYIAVTKGSKETIEIVIQSMSLSKKQRESINIFEF